MCAFSELCSQWLQWIKSCLLLLCYLSFTVDDIILSVNGISIEGDTHQHIIELIRESTNELK